MASKIAKIAIFADKSADQVIKENKLLETHFPNFPPSNYHSLDSISKEEKVFGLLEFDKPKKAEEYSEKLKQLQQQGKLSVIKSSEVANDNFIYSYDKIIELIELTKAFSDPNSISIGMIVAFLEAMQKQKFDQLKDEGTVFRFVFVTEKEGRKSVFFFFVHITAAELKKGWISNYYNIKHEHLFTSFTLN